MSATPCKTNRFTSRSLYNCLVRQSRRTETSVRLENSVSVSSTLDSAVWPHQLNFFVLGPAGDTEEPVWTKARAWACRRMGQMGQQMDKEAELPLICSENPESGHTQTGKRERSRIEQTGRKHERYSVLSHCSS